MKHKINKLDRANRLQEMHDKTGHSFRQCAIALGISKEFARNLVNERVLIVRNGGAVASPALKSPLIGYAQTVEDFLAAGGKITRLPSVAVVNCPQAAIPAQDLAAIQSIYRERERTDQRYRSEFGWKIKKASPLARQSPNE